MISRLEWLFFGWEFQQFPSIFLESTAVSDVLSIKWSVPAWNWPKMYGDCNFKKTQQYHSLWWCGGSPYAIYAITSIYKVPFNWKARGYWLKSHMYLIGLNFRGFLPVVFGWSFLDSALLFWFLSRLFGLIPQAFLLNGTLQESILNSWRVFFWGYSKLWTKCANVRL